LLDGSQQFGWLAQHLKSIPSSTDFVLITLHHPPVARLRPRRSNRQTTSVSPSRNDFRHASSWGRTVFFPLACSS
jgi:hypothetical protein